ncbi:MAG: choline dehydrogenase-like flavoprotein [Gammaproteobacteria bacterium]|jgi:choline dehydrogenase-like flavoprotein
MKLTEIIQELGFKDIHPAHVCVNPNGQYSPNRLQNSKFPIFRRSANLTIISGITARRLNIDAGGTLRSVFCSYDDNREIEIPCRGGIVCGGAIQSARLLMLYGSTHMANGIGNSNGHLGAHFMEHPSTIIGIKLKKQSEPQGNAMSFGQVQDWSLNKQLLAHGLGETLSLWRTNPRASDVLNIETIFEQLPNEKNRLLLDDIQKDEFGDALPKFWYDSLKTNTDTVQTAEKLLLNLLEISDKIAEIKILNRRQGSHHLYGTVRMAEDDNHGVVDKNLKVFGTKNLYVASSGTFPTTGAANPSLTVVALARRLGAHVLGL